MFSFSDMKTIKEKLEEIDDCIYDLKHDNSPLARKERLKLTLWRKNTLKNIEKLKRHSNS